MQDSEKPQQSNTGNQVGSISEASLSGPSASPWSMATLGDRLCGMRGRISRLSAAQIIWSWLGAFLGIDGIALLGHFLLASADRPFVIGSFGASAVLVYGAPQSPLAQPRNLIGGHVLSALVGVLCYQLFHPIPGLAEAVAVASAISVMQLTGTLHPPGGATALVAVIGSEELHALGYLFALVPVALGAVFLLMVALLINNLSSHRCYPEAWR